MCVCVCGVIFSYYNDVSFNSKFPVIIFGRSIKLLADLDMGVPKCNLDGKKLWKHLFLGVKSPYLLGEQSLESPLETVAAKSQKFDYNPQIIKISR